MLNGHDRRNSKTGYGSTDFPETVEKAKDDRPLARGDVDSFRELAFVLLPPLEGHRLSSFQKHWVPGVATVGSVIVGDGSFGGVNSRPIDLNDFGAKCVQCRYLSRGSRSWNVDTTGKTGSGGVSGERSTSVSR